MGNEERNETISDIQDPAKNSTHLYKARSGDVIWTRKETEENNHE